MTLEDVAKASGSSRATVSRFVNGDPRVSPRTADKISKAIETLGYVSNPSARALAGGTSKTIGLVFMESFRDLFRNSFWGEVVDAVSDVLWSENFQVAFLVNDRAKQDKVRAYLQQRHVDGVIVMSTSTERDLSATLTQEGFPCVVFGGVPGSGSVPTVDVDNTAVGAMAAGVLLKRGVRRPVVIAGRDDMQVSEVRVRGFIEEMKVAGITITPRDIASGGFTEEGGAAAMRQLARSHPDLDGVFAASDRMAIAAMDVVQDYGRRVPEDVAVVGVDGSSLGDLVRPGLTSIGADWTAIGHELAEQMLGALAGDPPTAVLHQPQLVQRHSA